MPGLTAEISRAEFEELKRAFPASSGALDKIAELTDRKAIIPLSRVTGADMSILPQDVTDRLYLAALEMREARFTSLFHQLREVVKLPRSRVSSVLEIGPGAGAFSALLRHYDYRVATLDLDPSKQPDVIGSITALPFAPGSVDMVCAFEVLQHLPYDRFRDTARELAACSRRYVYLSLPCRVNSISFHVDLRLIRRLARFSTNLSFSKILPGRMGDRDVGDGGFRQHYWEVNRRSYPKRRILEDLESVDLRVINQFHNPAYPVHYFILCEKT